jgi:hypothetical protein
MLRALIVGLAVTLMEYSGALAQSCIGNPVAVQVLGSGAPGFVKDRANTSYLLWIGNQAKIIVDVGVMCAEQGACVRRRSWAGYTIDMFEFEFPTGPWGSGVLRMHNSTKLTSNLVS